MFDEELEEELKDELELLDEDEPLLDVFEELSLLVIDSLLSKDEEEDLVPLLLGALQAAIKSVGINNK